MSIDYYEVLGVPPDASAEDIKKAYKKRALECHPDRSSVNHLETKESEDAFKKLSEAYNVLNNVDSRENYDRRRKTTPEGFTSRFAKVASVASSTAKVVTNFVDAHQESLFDTLDKILGRKKERKDIELSIKITIEELYEGLDKRVVFKRKVPCDTCKGRGALSIEDIKVCTDCYGLGHVMPPNLASFFTKEECKKCKGAGRILINKCGECHGKGECSYEREVTFPIPKDLNLGNEKDRLVIENEGEYGGNLIIQVELKPHRFYEVKWPDLYIDLPVQFYQAILGDYLEVETLRGSAVFTLPPGSEPGDTITMKGYGLRIPDNSGNTNYGDLYINITLDVPKRINKEQRELLEKYKKFDSTKRKLRPRAK